MAKAPGHRSRHDPVPRKREGQEIESQSTEERQKLDQASVEKGGVNKHRHHYLNHKRKRPNGH